MSTKNLFTRDPWPHQSDGVEQTIDAISNGTDSVCLTAPTGAGKTLMAIALTRYGTHGARKVLYLVNRLLLCEQTQRVFRDNGIRAGVIAASMKHLENADEAVQIAMTQTILARQRADQSYWVDADLLLVDEIHQQSSGESADLINEYKSRGAKVVGVTATPLGVSNTCDELIVAGRTRDLQGDGILCRARWHAPSELDTRKLVGKKADLSLAEDDARRTWGPLKGNDRIRTQIVGNMMEHYKRLHPAQIHTLAFAPGVKESVWAANYCRSMGIRSLHVDGDNFLVDGKLYDRKKDPKLFEESMEAWREGHISIIWNRFVMREGVDFPEIRCIILATPIGSYRSFLQMVGRGLRTHPGKEDCLVIDHGGNWWRHGTVNCNVDWEGVFDYEDPDILSKNRITEYRETGEPMGIACPRCGMVHKDRKRFTVCQYCGLELTLLKPSRTILQADGKLDEVTVEPITKWKIRQEPGDIEMWEGLYHNGAKKGFSFAQIYQQFWLKKARQIGTVAKPAYWHSYHLPRDLPLMPKNPHDWWRKMSSVDRSELY